jgi:hypothetical protein
MTARRPQPTWRFSRNERSGTPGAVQSLARIQIRMHWGGTGMVSRPASSRRSPWRAVSIVTSFSRRVPDSARTKERY